MKLQWRKLLQAIIPTVFFLFNLLKQSHCLGSMADIAAVYGESGSAFCLLTETAPSPAACHGSNSAVTSATPHHFRFLGLTAGDGFACGLLLDTRQPYCWGSSNYVQIGVPQPIDETSRYSEISAGDNHLCGLRMKKKKINNNNPPRGRKPRRDYSAATVDCWGYNMTKSYTFTSTLHSISAGSAFNCALFSSNATAVCWGDDTNSNVVSLTPLGVPFRNISAGGYHVCGILPNSTVLCWGRSLEKQQPPASGMASVVCGRFHTCGSMADTNQVTCWGFHFSTGKPLPPGVHATDLTAGDYFTCAVVKGRSPASPLCWGLGFPSPFPLAVIPGDPPKKPNNADSTNQSSASSSSSSSSSSCSGELFCGRGGGRWLPQVAVVSCELLLLFLFMAITSVSALIYIRRRLKPCNCVKKEDQKETDRGGRVEELRMRRAKVFTYKELERATDGFSEERQIGKGSFSTVFKGVLQDGTVVAVKRAAFSTDQKNSKEFKTELDLLSRLNHAHLLALLGYCEEQGERLLVYEFMANGSLHHHLHSSEKKTKLDWVRRVTIAVQAARGIEYLHGYACPPVIHRDIKSSNILIDEEHNARVSDFGLSLLGPAESGAALAELPAGTLGYLDPEYYRLHYLTTKSDVYSFGVMLLEMVSGRRAIDMRYEKGNVVEWAVPKVRGGEVREVLDPGLEVEEGGEVERALGEVAKVACRCVRMRGRERPSMEAVTTALEQALLLLLRGGEGGEGFILPSEVVLGSSRLHQKRERRVVVEEGGGGGDDERRTEFRAPSWITFPSVASSSQRRKEGEDEIEEEV